MIIYLTFEQVLAINEQVIGGRAVRDAGCVDSACGRPRATVFGEDAYPSVWEKAAALMQSLACNYGFIGGNERTAWIAVTAFLKVVATGVMRDVPAIANVLVKFAR